MNEIRLPIRAADEIQAILTIVRRHSMPDFVTDYRLELGEFNDSPAVWVTLLLKEDLAPGDPNLEPWVVAIDHTIDGIRDDLLEQYPARYPLFRMAVA